MKNLDILIANLKQHQEAMNILEQEIDKEYDGFVYITVIHAFRNITAKKHSNYYSALKVAEQYGGDNGSCDIYTTNPNAQKYFEDINDSTLVIGRTFEELKSLLAQQYEGRIYHLDKL